MDTCKVALKYIDAGISIIPVARDGNKMPDKSRLPRVPDKKHPDKFNATWKPFQSRIATEEEVHQWYNCDYPPGIALVCGKVSGGLQCLDFDAGELHGQWLDMLTELEPELAEKLTTIQTPRKSGGYHVWFRCSDVEGNRVLAKTAGSSGNVLIETRGEGGYALAPGTPADCHPEGGLYVPRRGSPINKPVEVTPQQRRLLLDLAHSFDRSTQKEPRRQRVEGNPPWQDFDRRGPSFAELLPSGWDCVRGEPDDGLWLRPGKDRGCSASTQSRGAQSGAPLLRVFSSASECQPLQPEKTYGKSDVFCLVECGGDYAEAARRLRAMGFGSQNTGPETEANGKTATNGKHTGEEQEWPEPIDLNQNQGEATPFPLDVFPGRLTALCHSVADAIPCPVDYPACFALGLVAGTAGAAYALEVKPTYYESTSLYLCVVASVSSGKSPALKILSGPIYEDQNKRWVDGDNEPAYVGDVTVEKLADLMKDQARGLLMIRDELTAWVTSMDQYKSKGSGSDRQFYLSVWSGDPVSVHRKNPDSPALFIGHPCLSVVGGIQPDLVENLRGAKDGFFERVLLSFPPRIPAQPESWKQVDQVYLDRWGAALSIIRDTPMVIDSNGVRRPNFVKLSGEARQVWYDWTVWVAEEDASSDPEVQSLLAKIKGYAARLALIVHLVNESYGEHHGRDLSAEDMDAGVKLARYFFEHSLRIRATSRSSARIEKAAAILKWLSDRPQSSHISRSDIWRSLRRNPLFRQPEDLISPLNLLTQTEHLRAMQSSRGTVGRPTSEGWLINPLIYSPSQNQSTKST